MLRQRDQGLERELDVLAARAGGYADDGGLGDYANYRAHPGGVRRPPGRDLHVEMAEELADARNYAVWAIEPIYQRVVDGDSAAMDEYVRLMRALQYVVAAWRALHAA